MRRAVPKTDAYVHACIAIKEACDVPPEELDDPSDFGTVAATVRTYFPSTLGDRMSLADKWRKTAADEAAAKQLAAEKAAAAAPVQRNGVGWVRPRKKPQVEETPLTELMAEQQRMLYEANVVEKLRLQAERDYVKLLSRTPDIANGRLDDLLAETRRITGQALPPRAA